jgi:hypothetical protein
MRRPLNPTRARSCLALAAVLLVCGSVEAAPKKTKAPKKARPGAAGPADGAIAGEAAPLACRSPDEIAAGAELVIECDNEAWLEGAKVVLHYRAAGKDGYTAVAMESAPKKPLRGKVPGTEMTPPFTLYYVQASVEGAGLVAAAGRPDSPTVVRVQPPPPPPLARVADVGVSESNTSGRRPTVDWLASFAKGSARAPGAFWAGLSLGSGYGWSSRSRLEYRSDLEAGAGFGPAGLAHLAPEVGYQLTPQIAVALAGRHQFISGGAGEPAYPGQPAHWAHAVLARGLYTVDRGFFGFHGAFQVGGGSGFRFRFSPDPVSGRPRHDTTRGGPVVLGPGAGIVYRLRDRYALVAETNLLFGVPDFALMTDVTLGVQINL